MKTLVVSLHDVSPLTRAAFTLILQELAAWGIRKTSLLVVADHHHRGHFLRDTSFCRWLEELSAAGHEIVIHGYHHQREARPRETIRDRWITSVYTSGEGEFFDLSRDEAAVLLSQAKDDFGRINIPAPSGFIAPAWLLSEAARDAVREAGFRYTTFLTGLEVFRPSVGSDGFLRSQSLVYSCRNHWRRVCSQAWNAALTYRLRHSPLLRFGLHPPDYHHPRVWQQIRRLARAAVAAREVSTYEAFVEAHHPQPAVANSPA